VHRQLFALKGIAAMTIQSNMTVLILGSRGRLGAALVDAFAGAGWRVLRQVRKRETGDEDDTLVADARDARSVLNEIGRRAVTKVDVVINACNPPYTRWHIEALPLNAAAIDIATQTNATLIFPGNVYNFGAAMPEHLLTDTRQLAATRKGRIRIEMELALKRAADNGLQCVIIRAGNFFGCKPGSWFDLVIAEDLMRGKIGMPGSPGVPQPWAYMPDLVQTFVNVATARHTLGVFEQVHFAGHTLQLQQIAEVIERLTQRQYKRNPLPWRLIRGLSFAVPMWREIAELAYLWERPHELVTAPAHLALMSAHTPTDDAFRDAISSRYPALIHAQPRLA
jgi:nucleoside-diphosphate-sugar epimerase